jgi:hypothetical protein
MYCPYYLVGNLHSGNKQIMATAWYFIIFAAPATNKFLDSQVGKDYYILPNGLLVFTASYLLRRGYCCGNGCLNCPYQYECVPEPKRTLLLQKRRQDDHGKEK